MKKLLFFSLLTILLSCTESSQTNNLFLNIDMIVKQNDSINVYYTQNEEIDFIDKQSFWTNVEGNSKNQTVKIAFPDTVIPKQIRIDFGNNLNQPEIVLNKMDFYFKKEHFSLKGKEIYYYFRIDGSVTELDLEMGTLKRKDSLQTRGPSLYPKGDNLFNKLNEFQNN